MKPFSLAVLILFTSTIAQAQQVPAGPSEDVEQVTAESETPRQTPLTTLDRPIYRATQDLKKELSSKYGIHFALEDTAIYQITSGVVEENQAMVNTLGLFATWKIFRDPNGKDFTGFGFQFEPRGNPVGEFTDMRNDLGTLYHKVDYKVGIEKEGLKMYVYSRKNAYKDLDSVYYTVNILNIAEHPLFPQASKPLKLSWLGGTVHEFAQTGRQTHN